MPSSKEVRARQNRQKERVAAQLAERRKLQRRRRQLGGIAGVIIVILAVVLAIVAGSNNKSGAKVAVAPTTVAGPTTTGAPSTTVAPLASVKGKPCVGLKDTLPKGSPGMPLVAGPAPTKLVVKDLSIGPGAVVPKNATVTVNYVGVACSTGKIFDSSYTDGSPFSANLNGGVIPGWEQGIPGMKLGGVRLLSIPASLAYGASGSAPAIAPDESLFFLVSAVKLG